MRRTPGNRWTPLGESFKKRQARPGPDRNQRERDAARGSAELATQTGRALPSRLPYALAVPSGRGPRFGKSTDLTRGDERQERKSWGGARLTRAPAIGGTRPRSIARVHISGGRREVCPRDVAAAVVVGAGLCAGDGCAHCVPAVVYRGRARNNNRRRRAPVFRFIVLATRVRQVEAPACGRVPYVSAPDYGRKIAPRSSPFRAKAQPRG